MEASTERSREPLVFVGPSVLKSLEHFLALYKPHDARADDALAAAYRRLILELRKPQFKIIKLEALIEHVMSLPRLKFADQEAENVRGDEPRDPEVI